MNAFFDTNVLIEIFSWRVNYNNAIIYIYRIDNTGSRSHDIHLNGKVGIAL
jgi:hypothetical protein